MEKVVDSEELMDCIRGDSVIYLCSNKGFKIAREKNICIETNDLCTGNW